MKTFLIFISVFITILTGCKKSAYLDANPNQSLIIPTDLEDFQAILDNTGEMNGQGGYPPGLVPGLGEGSAGSYYPSPALIQYMPVTTSRIYTWSDDFYDIGTGEGFIDWVLPYRAIYNANVVLEGLQGLKVSPDQQADYDHIKGSALFHRAHMLYHLAQIFAQPYSAASADKDLGLPLRMISDINEKITRSSVQETYNRIITDLLEARSLLPVNVEYKTRPSLPALYALLSRTYLVTGKFDDALKYADSCLKLNSTLEDYNTINDAAPWALAGNNEILFIALMTQPGSLVSDFLSRIDSSFYKSYEDDDLRKKLFFGDASIYGDPESYYFQGSYVGNPTHNIFFGGIATDEIFLVRAECNARLGKTAEAMSDLNTLLRNRYKSGTFTDIVASSADEALQIILSERKKELIFRGLRWSDLRRLNAEGASITLTRQFGGKQYELQPNSSRYTFLIPPDVMSFHLDWQQNPR